MDNIKEMRPNNVIMLEWLHLYFLETPNEDDVGIDVNDVATH